jgi:hypothetical protein
MPERYKQLIGLLLGFAMLLAMSISIGHDYSHARRFVRYGVEKQGTILSLERVISGRSPVSDYVYSLQIDQTVIVKKFPYNWWLPIKRSFLVLSDSPGADDIALGNNTSSPFTVLCYMEGWDEPGRLFLFLFGLGVAVTLFPYFLRKLIRNWADT